MVGPVLDVGKEGDSRMQCDGSSSDLDDSVRNVTALDKRKEGAGSVWGIASEVSLGHVDKESSRWVDIGDTHAGSLERKLNFSQTNRYKSMKQK